MPVRRHRSAGTVVGVRPAPYDPAGGNGDLGGPVAHGVDAEFRAYPLRALAGAALERATALGASHADFRLERVRGAHWRLRDGRPAGSGDHTDLGIAVRVVHGGAWGFAAGVDLTTDAAAAVAERAVSMARMSARVAAAAGHPDPVELAGEPVYPDAEWVSAYRTDPFAVPDADKTALLADWSGRLLSAPGVSHVDASLWAVRENKFYADTAGTSTLQQRVRIAPAVNAIAVDDDGFDTMRTLAPPAGRGWEYTQGEGWDWDAELAELRPLVAGGADAGFTDPPAETSAAVFDGFTPALGTAFATAAAGGRELYGFAQHWVNTTYLGSSTGLRRRHEQPGGTLELNGKSPDHTRSAWVGLHTRDFTDVDLAALDAELARRLGWARRQIELPAGRYPTLLPPSAVADLMVWMSSFAGARDTAEGRTAFSAPGGGTRVGERLTDLPLTLRGDPAEPGLETAPYVIAHGSGGDRSVFDNGLPVGATEWISGGTLAALPSSRFSAAKAGLPAATPAVGNLVLSGGGDADLAAMVAGTDRGLLLTCLWYVRDVDPATMLVTGLTRDGVYLVEGGEVVGVVNNFRFNESPVDLLGRATEAGRTVRTLGRETADWMTRVAMPPLRIPDFNMSTVSPGV